MQVELRVQANGQRTSTTKSADWLDGDFLQLCMQSGENDPTIRVMNHTITGMIPPSGSSNEWMYSVTVQFKRRPRSRNILDFKPQETRHLLIKVIPQVSEKQENDHENVLFTKEMAMLSSTLPAIGRQLGHFSLGPQCLYSERSPRALLVLEDLSTNDYVMGKMGRHGGLDFNHCMLAMEAMARLHAGSVAVYEKDNSSMDPFDDNVWFKRDMSITEEIVERAVTNVADEVATWPSFGDKYAEKIRGLKDTLLPKLTAAFAKDESKFNVLNHGNCWYDNLKFRYGTTSHRVEDVTFVDFKHSVFASPAIDIQHFLSSTPTDEVRHQNLNRLVQHYHRTLVVTMEKLKTKTKPPSKEDLTEEIDKRGLYGVLVAFTLLPVISSVDTSQSANILELRVAKEAAEKQKLYSSEQFKASLKRLLPFFDSKGYLD